MLSKLLPRNNNAESGSSRSLWNRISSFRLRRTHAPDNNPLVSPTKNTSTNISCFSRLRRVFRRTTEQSSESLESQEDVEESEEDIADRKKWENACLYRITTHIAQLENDPAVARYTGSGIGSGKFERLLEFTNKSFTKGLVRAIFKECTLNGPTKICNAGNECFGVATIQAYFACPPFIEYVKTKKPRNEIDHIVRSLVAQYIVKWRYIHVTDLLKKFEFQVNTPDDAELFMWTLAEQFFDNAFGSVDFEQTCECLNCHTQSITFQKNTRTLLNNLWLPEYCFFSIQKMIEDTAKPETVDRHCSECGHNKCTKTSRYIFPKVVLFSFTFLGMRLSQQRDFFARRVDLSPMDDIPSGSYYELGAVLWHKKVGNLGHFMTDVYRGNDIISTDDLESDIKATNWDEQFNKGLPYFILYYKK